MTIDPRNPSNEQLRILAQIASAIRVYDRKVLDGNAAIAAGKVHRAAELCGHLTEITHDLEALWLQLPDRPAWPSTRNIGTDLTIGPSVRLRALIEAFEAAP